MQFNETSSYFPFLNICTERPTAQNSTDGVNDMNCFTIRYICTKQSLVLDSRV